MCRKAMDLKPKHHFKSELRRIVGPRLGLRLLRVAVEQDTGLTHWRSSLLVNSTALKKYLYKAKKRAHLAKLAKHVSEGENMEEMPSLPYRHAANNEISTHNTARCGRIQTIVRNGPCVTRGGTMTENAKKRLVLYRGRH
uniref:Uncharacterized protein n=1 Tax=Knipowitschia caucasica TaxID=637954 RepID=A0AAV2IXL4_KNICA